MSINVYPLIFIFLALLFCNIKHFRFRLDSRKKLLILLLLFLGIIYWFYVPNIHRVYDDEMMILARSVHYDGSLYDSSHEVQKHMTIKAIYHIAFAIFGTSNILAIKVNIILALLDLCLLYALIKLIYPKSTITPLLAVIILAIQPFYISAATSSYNMIITLFFSLFSTIVFILFIRHDKFWLNLLLLITLILLILCRFEFIILFFIYAAFWVGLRRRKKLRYWAGYAAFWILCLVPVIIYDYIPIILYRLNEYSKEPTRGFSPADLFSNTRALISNKLLIHNSSAAVEHFIVGLFLISIASLILLLYYYKKSKKGISWKELLLGTASLSFLVFYFMNSLIQPWYFIVIFAYLLYLPAGILPLPFKIKNMHLKAVYLILLIAALTLVFSTSVSVVRQESSPGVEPWALLTTFSPQILESYVPNECLTITTRARNIMMGSELGAKDTKMIIENKKGTENETCLYFFEDYLCKTDSFIPGTVEECSSFKKSGEFTVILNIIDPRSGWNNTLYRLDFKNKTGVIQNSSAVNIYI